MLPPAERALSFAEVETGYSREDLRRETARCLECGCSALFTCDLRRYATEYGADLTTFMGEAVEHPVDRRHPLLVLDPNKCVLCGRCVRICSELVGVAAYGFVKRGFDTVVKPALGDSLLDTECVSCGLCIGTCPTGAIAEKLPLAKSGPWKTNRVESVCPYCSAGCRLGYEVSGTTLVQVSRAGDGTGGNHCKKGRFGYGHVQSAERLRWPLLRVGRELQETSLDEALRYSSMRLKELARRYSGDQVAVFVSPRLTNEEIYLAQKLARVALRTHNVTSLAHLVNRELQAPEVVSTASCAEIRDAQALLVVNTALDEESFAVDIACKQAIRKGARLVYVGPEDNLTSRFAELHLRCLPGGQAFAILGLLKDYAALQPGALDDRPELARAVADLSDEHLEKLSGVARAASREAAALLARTILKVMLFNKDYRGSRRTHDERLFAEAAAAMSCSLLALREKANSQGLLDMGADPRWLPGYVDPGGGEALEKMEKELGVVLGDLSPPGLDVAQLLRDKKIRVAVVLGEDPVGAPGFPQELSDGLLAADFLLVGDLLPHPHRRPRHRGPAAVEHGGDERHHDQRRAPRSATAARGPPRGRDGDLGDPHPAREPARLPVQDEVRVRRGRDRGNPTGGADLGGARPWLRQCGLGRRWLQAAQGSVHRAGGSARPRPHPRARHPGGPLLGLVRQDLREGPPGAARRMRAEI